MSLIVNGKTYEVAFYMLDIENVLSDIGAGTDLQKASDIMAESATNPIKLSQIAAICAFRGIEGHNRKNKIENVFGSLDEFKDEVTSITELESAIGEFSKAFTEFFKFSEQKGSKKKTAGSH